MKTRNSILFRCYANNRASVFLTLLISIFVVTAAQAETNYRIRSSDNLSRIVDEFYPNSSLTKSQIMVSILTENPKAFKSGNVNFLLKGRTILLPDEIDLAVVSEDDALLILANHALLFEDGIASESETSIDTNSDETKKITTNQNKQLQKITKLENETEDLRGQLEQLLKEKGQRDEKLKELEVAIQKSLPDVPTPKSSTPSPIEVTQEVNVDAQAKRLEEKNKALKKELQESRSALAENARSKISLERRLTDLKNEKKAVAETVVDKPVEEKKSVKVESTKSTIVDSLPPSIKGFFENNSKFVWLVPLLLLLGLWYLFSLLKRDKKRPAVSYDDDLSSVTAAYRETNDDLDLDYKEGSLETDLKLDIAKAYSETGDNDAALGILREVMEEGDAEQRNTAQAILNSM